MANLKPTHEPVAYSNVVTAILTGLVTTGWISVPDTTINIISTVVGVAFAGLVTVLSRFGVIPLAKLGAKSADDVPAGDNVPTAPEFKPEPQTNVTPNGGDAS